MTTEPQNHKLAAAEEESRRATKQQADEVAKLLSSHLYGAAAEWVTNLLAERDALLEENKKLKRDREAVAYAASPFGR